MDWDSIIAIVLLTAISTIALGAALLKLYLKTFVKTTVEESVKHEFETQRQKMRQDFEREMQAGERKDRFRLAALDERLRVFQKAFALWRQMLSTLHLADEKKGEVRARFDDFWNNHSLYLSSKVRTEFVIVYSKYSGYNIMKTLLRDAKIEGRSAEVEDARRDLLEAWHRIENFGRYLEEAVDLEAMGNQPITTAEGKKVDAFGIEEGKEE